MTESEFKAFSKTRRLPLHLRVEDKDLTAAFTTALRKQLRRVRLWRKDSLRRMLTNMLKAKLGKSDRKGVPRVKDVQIVEDIVDKSGKKVIFVEWAIPNLFFESVNKTKAKLEVVEILKVIQDSNIDNIEVSLFGSFGMIDKFGNSSEDVVVKCIFERATVDQINWDEFLLKDIYDLADQVSIHPSFR